MWGMWHKRYDLLRPPPVIAILGPPGSGKSAQCLKLLQFFDFFYMSNDYLIYEEIASGSHKGRYFEFLMHLGDPIPIDMVICLYKALIYRSAGATSGFIIEGFPATEANAKRFEKTVTPFDLIIYLDCGDDALVERLQKRNQENNLTVSEGALRMKIKNYRDEAYELFHNLTPKSILINAERGEEEVFEDVTAVLDCLFKKRALVDPPECTPLTICPFNYGKEKKKPPEPKEKDICPPKRSDQICPWELRKCRKDEKKDPFQQTCYGWTCKPLEYTKN